MYSLVRVNGNWPKTGPALLLKVMSGDKVDVATKSFYKSGGTVSSPNSSLSDILNSLAGSLVTETSGTHGGITDFTNSSTPTYVDVNSFLSNNDSNLTSKPKAYLNWILLDDQFKAVTTYPQSGAIPVGSANVLNTLAYSGIPITKSGYLYIWVSNETPGWDVFFDNLSVKHYRGPITEETHYYPFGLTMAGISDKAAGGLEYKYKYNAIELDTSLGLNEYDAQLRDLDPQTGRWWQIDPEIEDQEMWSPYTSNNDNPILYSDPRGNEGEACCGGLVQLAEDIWDVSSAVRGAQNVSEAAQNHTTTGETIYNTLYKMLEFDQGGIIKVDPKDLPVNKNSKTTLVLTLPKDGYLILLPPDTKVKTQVKATKNKKEAKNRVVNQKAGEKAQNQLEGLEKAQAKAKKNASSKGTKQSKINSTKKSQQNLDYQLKSTKNLKDAEKF